MEHGVPLKILANVPDTGRGSVKTVQMVRRASGTSQNVTNDVGSHSGSVLKFMPRPSSHSSGGSGPEQLLLHAEGDSDEQLTSY